MARYFSEQTLLDMKDKDMNYVYDLTDLEEYLAGVPTADVVEVETIKAWLYAIAINNVGCVLEGDFSVACEEIISRLDGLRNFARERETQKGGEEQ